MAAAGHVWESIPWGSEHLDDDGDCSVKRIDYALALEGANLARLLVQQDFYDVLEVSLPSRQKW